MNRVRFAQITFGWLAAQVLLAKERSYIIFQETTTSEYKLQIQIEGVGSTVTKVIVGIFPLPGKVTQTLSVLTVLKNKTALVESSGIVIEFGDQPRFMIVTIPLGARKKMRVRGGFEFRIDGVLPLGYDVNVERALIAPTSSLLITLLKKFNINHYETPLLLRQRGRYPVLLPRQAVGKGYYQRNIR